jgi:uncharacterized membrane protein
VSDKDFELAPWIVGLISFALTPAIIFLIGSALVALFLVFAMLLIAKCARRAARWSFISNR